MITETIKHPSSEKTYIGIDPGLNGAMAVIGSTHYVVVDTPTFKVKSGKKTKNCYNEQLLVGMLESFDPKHTHIAIEKVHSMPGQGVASMFSMGEGYGLWRGIITALKFPYTLVTPQAWKKEMMAGMSKEKAASCVRAQQLFPEADVFGPKGGPKDGRGDALLIAEYIKRQL